MQDEKAPAQTTDFDTPYFMWGFDDESIFMIDADGKQVCIQQHPDLLDAIQRVCREWDESRRKVVQK